MNCCIFTGRIDACPELKATPNGTLSCTISLAVQNGYGENSTTVFPTIVSFGNQAEFLSKLPKGTKITVRCTYMEREFTKRNGEKRRAKEFRLQEAQIASYPKMENNLAGTDKWGFSDGSELPF